LAARAHCWLMVNLSSTRTPRSLSAELLSSRSTPSLYWCHGYIRGVLSMRAVCLKPITLLGEAN